MHEIKWTYEKTRVIVHWGFNALYKGRDRNRDVVCVMIIKELLGNVWRLGGRVIIFY